MGQKRNHAGFTLIELMIVVAIIGVLVAIAIPQFVRFSAKTRRAEGITLLKGFYTAENAYFATHDAYAHGGGVTLGIPIRLGYSAAGKPKFYNLDDPTSPLQQLWTASGDPTEGCFPDCPTSFMAEMHGQLDTDALEDYLFIGTNAFPGYATPGEVIAIPGNDDVND